MEQKQCEEELKRLKEREEVINHEISISWFRELAAIKTNAYKKMIKKDVDLMIGQNQHDIRKRLIDIVQLFRDETCILNLIFVYLSTELKRYVYICLYVCMYVCMYMDIYGCIYVYFLNIFMYMYMYIYIHTMYMYIYIYIHLCINVYI
jgi:hypothetical protein